MTTVAVILIILLAGVPAGSILWRTWRNETPPMPTSPRVADALLGSIGHLPAGSTIYELGSGWGTLARPLARRFPHCRVMAIENSPLPIMVSRLVNRLHPCPNLSHRRADFYDLSLEPADMIVCYLCTGAMRRLREKFNRELRPGSRVITHTFSVPGWIPEQTIRAGDLYRTPIYHYHQPATAHRPDQPQLK